MIATTEYGDNVFVDVQREITDREIRIHSDQDACLENGFKVRRGESLTSTTGRVSDASDAFPHRIRRTAEDAFRKGSVWF